MGFNSKDPQILEQQLIVEKLVLESDNGGLYTVAPRVISGPTTVYDHTVQFNEPIDHAVAVLECLDAGPTVTLVSAANVVVGSDGTSLVITLAAALTTNDSLVIYYVNKLS